MAVARKDAGGKGHGQCAGIAEQIRSHARVSRNGAARIGDLYFASLRKVYDVGREPQPNTVPANENRTVNFCAAEYTAEKAIGSVAELVRKESEERTPGQGFHYETWMPFDAKADTT